MHGWRARQSWGRLGFCSCTPARWAWAPSVLGGTLPLWLEPALLIYLCSTLSSPVREGGRDRAPTRGAHLVPLQGRQGGIRPTASPVPAVCTHQPGRGESLG